MTSPYFPHQFRKRTTDATNSRHHRRNSLRFGDARTTHEERSKGSGWATTFKFQVFKRYGPKCRGVWVIGLGLLDAAHIRPKLAVDQMTHEMAWCFVRTITEHSMRAVRYQSLDVGDSMSSRRADRTALGNNR